MLLNNIKLNKTEAHARAHARARARVRVRVRVPAARACPDGTARALVPKGPPGNENPRGGLRPGPSVVRGESSAKGGGNEAMDRDFVSR